MQFDTRRVDFGKVKKGEKREHTFRFINMGTAPLVIDLISACDCTTVTYDQGKAYQPGESGSIHIVFDSTEKDASETVGIELFLKNTIPGTDVPIMEELEYSFDLIK